MNLPPHRSEMNAEEVAYENLFKFIMKQSSTLKNINIGTSKITVDQMEILLKLNLLDLGFQSCEFIYDREISIENFSIQSLFISMEGCEENEQVLCDLIESCKKLKETRFVWAVLKFEVCFSIRKSGIEKLSMFHGQIFPMTIPSLKILDVDGLMAQIETIKFIRLNPQLKELHVPGSFQNFEMFSQAIDELENLEILYLS
ncbi:hypothetical protein PVAND_014200 [Polypedilum vanderplanki]|uniref:Uncharacterized protein n=1 Tax=Polypedilum vanderplanki TaxID=319348 RepID=A0A9J6CSF4_POLVA|nr:hypothetical protein PVAND_014200 [Polypedilum vanderplanki]